MLRAAILTLLFATTLTLVGLAQAQTPAQLESRSSALTDTTSTVNMVVHDARTPRLAE
jgi:outer membrane lipoprotein-sorting protein